MHLPYFTGDPQGQAMQDEALKYDRVWILTGIQTRTGRGTSVDTAEMLLPLLEDFGAPVSVEQTDSVMLWLFERPTPRSDDLTTRVPAP